MLHVPHTTTVEFLRHFGLYHALCAFHPSNRAKHFKAGGADAVLSWAKEWNEAGFNIYFHPNAVQPGFIGKATTDDISHIVSVHDDNDWGWKANTGRYHERITELTAQQDALHASATPPSLSVFTGGGFQNYYLLKQPLPNTHENRARVEAVVRTFVAERGSDMVGNADRIMRLPGFFNYPNPKKEAAGQPVALARVLP